MEEEKFKRLRLIDPEQQAFTLNIIWMDTCNILIEKKNPIIFQCMWLRKKSSRENIKYITLA